MMKYKLLIICILIAFSGVSHAFVINGTSTQPVMDGDIVKADTEAREQAMLDALKNYFSKLKSMQPDKEIPDVTTEFFKFIKSYKIAERKYADDSVTYTVLADVDDVALNDLTYFVRNAVNTMVYNITGVGMEAGLENSINETFKEYKFDTRHQSDYQASLKEHSTPEERLATFGQNQAQYFMEMALEREPAAEGTCSVILTTITFSKTKEFKTLKTKSSAEDESDDSCVQTAATHSLLKTLGYVRANFIPLPSGEHALQTYTLRAVNYNNFATPKKIMEELKKRSFIDSYKIKSFAGNQLDVDIVTYVDISILIKKLQSIEVEYGFKALEDQQNNILLDFTQ